jgi:hypothetical protein
MSVATMPVLERPLPKAPGSANMSNVWRDGNGQLQEHTIELPVDKTTHKINGRLYACVVAECPTAEWIIEPKQALPEEKTHCPRDGQPLSWVPLDPTQQDPLASGRQLQQSRLASLWAKKKTEAAEKIRQSAAVRAALETKASAPAQAATLATEMKGHLPSLAAAAAIEVGVVYTVDLTSALETAAIASVVTVGGIVVGYLLAVIVEQIRARLRKEGFEGRAAKKARERGLWAGRGAISVGLFMGVTGAVEGLAGLDAAGLGDGLKWGFIALLGLGLAWWTNRAHWERLWAERRRLRQLAADKIRKAEEERIRRLEEEARRLEEEARQREQLAEVEAWDDDNPLHQGRRMAIEWQRISRLETAVAGFPKINKTEIVPEKTREITAPDPETGKPMRIGWEYYGKCVPGALVTGSGMVPPIIAAKEWLVSVLFDGEYDAAAISLLDTPEGKQNTFLMMITERARLGDAVPWRAETAVRVDHKGVRYGYLGRSLTGDDLEEVLYAPTQPFGGLATGTTGGGKGGFAVRYLLNCLFGNMFPILFDPKGLVDFADFAGLFPIGFTKRHRRIILESLHAERQRRESRLASAPKTNRYGAQVAGTSKWNTHDETTGEIGVYGEPILALFDEFHDLAKDQGFLLDLTNHVRFQRAAAMGVLLLSQGGGLDDWGNSVLRDLGSMTSRTNFRGGDMQSKLSGNKSKYSTADLPNLPGMCLREAPGSPDVPLRAAFISREPDDEDTVYTTLWGKGAERVMQIEDPMNWISDETKALWEETGLMDLWRLARGPGGLARLLADTQEDEEDQDDSMVGEMHTGSATLMRMPEKAVATSRMTAREVLLAILHESPGIDWEGIMASDAWNGRAPGWAKQPAKSTITRAADDLGDKIDRGPDSKSWRLTEAGAKAGAEAARQLASPVVVASAGHGAHSSRPSAISIAEMAAQQAAEMAQVIAKEAAMASRSS